MGSGGWGGSAGTSKPVSGFDVAIFPRALEGLRSHSTAKESLDLRALHLFLYAVSEKQDMDLQRLLEKKLSLLSGQILGPEFLASLAGEDFFSQVAAAARLLFDAFSFLRLDHLRESGFKLIDFLDGFYDEKLGAFVDPKKTGAAFAFQNAVGARAFLSAYPHLQNPQIRDKAGNALNFIREKLYDPLLGLINRFPPESETLEYGRLADCAVSILALTDAYLQSGDKSYRDFADILAKYLLQDLWDREKGGFLPHSRAEPSQEKVSKETLSSNAAAFEALWRLGYLKGQNAYFKWADLGLHRFLDEKNPEAEASFAHILDMRSRGRIELEIVGRAEEEVSQRMLETLATLYAPRKIISFINPDDQDYILAHGLDAESYPRLFGCVNLKRCADTPNSDRESVSRVLNAAWHC